MAKSSKRAARKKAQEPQNAHSGEAYEQRKIPKLDRHNDLPLCNYCGNLFGESLQLHEQHTLGDVMRDRPVFVSYNWFFNYVIEAFIVLLFLVWYMGRKAQ